MFFFNCCCLIFQCFSHGLHLFVLFIGTNDIQYRPYDKIMFAFLMDKIYLPLRVSEILFQVRHKKPIQIGLKVCGKNMVLEMEY